MMAESRQLRIAVPLVDGRVADHFGRSRRFAIFEADAERGTVGPCKVVEAPEHEPGILPEWLEGESVSVVISKGMGHRALKLFTERGISVVVGAEGGDAWSMVHAYIEGILGSGLNPCDH